MIVSIPFRMEKKKKEKEKGSLVMVTKVNDFNKQ